MRPFALFFIAVCACAKQPTFTGTDEQLAEALGKALSEACPMSAADDEIARSQCAQALTDLSLLRDNAADPFVWGQQEDGGVPMMTDSVTRFAPLVYRRLYLSLYMFPAEHRVEKLDDGRVLLHVAAKFRNKLDMGSYPYPFWHKPGKWFGYQRAAEVIFAISQGKVTGAVRSYAGTEGRFTIPAQLPDVVHEWGGQWTWTVGGEDYPKAALYTWLLSTDNPHREALEASYRDLEHEMRQSSCMMCHQPDNADAMPVLELFSFPNQALAGRHRIVQQLESNAMPYPDAVRGVPGGYHGADDAKRQTLLDLAKKFAAAGDDALKYEGEPVQ